MGIQQSMERKVDKKGFSKRKTDKDEAKAKIASIHYPLAKANGNG